jgi:hypothetical protein
MSGICFSYVREDRHLASQLVADLEESGHPSPWLHRMFTEWRVPPPLDIDQVDRLVVLWTRNSLAQEWLRKEALVAHRAGKLVQVRAEDVLLSDVPAAVSSSPIFRTSELDAIAQAVLGGVDDPPAMRAPEEASPSLPTAPRPYSIAPSSAPPEPEPVELGVGALFLRRRAVSRLSDDAPLPRSTDDITLASRPPPVDVPRTEPGAPLARAPARMAPPPGMPMPAPAAKALRAGLPLAAILVATVAVAGAWKAGLLDSLASAAGKLLAFLKLNSFPPAGALPGAQEDTEVVDCSVFAPPSAAPGKSIFVQVFLHPPEQLDRAEAIAGRIDPGSRLRSIATLQTEVARGQRLAITLDCPAFSADAPSREVVWRGRPQAVSIRVTVPADARHGQEFFPVVRVSVEGVPVGFLEFVLTCEDAQTGEADATGKEARRYRYAFLSHASQDRTEVIKFARALSAAKIDFFQDIFSLRPGDDWEQRLFEEIDRCDVFYLFWSQHSAQSEMVRREAEHAHRRAVRMGRRVPDITPIRLDSSPLPTHPPHPAWMPKIHFDDHFRRLIEAEDANED